MKNRWKYTAATAPQREQVEQFRKQYAKLNEQLEALPVGKDRACAITHLEDSFSRLEDAILLYEAGDAG